MQNATMIEFLIVGTLVVAIAGASLLCILLNKVLIELRLARHVREQAALLRGDPAAKAPELTRRQP